MDFQLLKTFQEVAATGSFGAAAGRLFVTQSAVSLRVLRLEDQLGRSLFDRNKGGAVLTAAGREFQGHATMILHNWEQARQKVSAVENAAKVMTLAAQPSLGPYFGFDWLDRIRAELPDITLHFEGARPGALAELILSGDAQAIVTCQALVRPGLASECLMEDRCQLSSRWPWQFGNRDRLHCLFAVLLPDQRQHVPDQRYRRIVVGLGAAGEQRPWRELQGVGRAVDPDQLSDRLQ